MLRAFDQLYNSRSTNMLSIGVHYKLTAQENLDIQYCTYTVSKMLTCTVSTGVPYKLTAQEILEKPTQ